MDKRILKTAALNAGLTFAYIAAVSAFMTYMGSRHADEPDGFLAPVMALTLLVTSAAITGYLVVGKPLMWYLDGQKQDAVRLLGATIGCLAIVAVLLVVFVA